MKTDIIEQISKTISVGIKVLLANDRCIHNIDSASIEIAEAIYKLLNTESNINEKI